METKQGFILSYIKYNDTGAVVKILEKDTGLQSYFIKNIYLAKRKKKVYLSPLMGVEFSTSKPKNAGLASISSMALSDFAKPIELNFINQAQMALLAELLLKIMPYEDSDTNLYHYLSAFCLNIESKNALIYYFYHIIKAMGYGFSFTEGLYFDVKNGQFDDVQHSLSIDQHHSAQLRAIETPHFLSLALNSSERRVLIDILMNYCQIHIPDFTLPKSLDIFRDIF
ncbi:DNA repair protein RecO [Riemerella columbina]|uniref:DNA repair protein RecO n=1 Tax=Riemerella columbina TaxID=103810 RepID=UPI00266F18C9|nr:recombination protein O N-terminal domain-containing protein [Riemerella columbina]WKS96033.1 recombination protein O N-terminal domain-containing protein [Riemerella columbina]